MWGGYFQKSYQQMAKKIGTVFDRPYYGFGDDLLSHRQVQYHRRDGA